MCCVQHRADGDARKQRPISGSGFLKPPPPPPQHSSEFGVVDSHLHSAVSSECNETEEWGDFT